MPAPALVLKPAPDPFTAVRVLNRMRAVGFVLELDGPAYRAELSAVEQELLQAEKMLAFTPDNTELKEQVVHASKELEQQRTITRAF